MKLWLNFSGGTEKAVRHLKPEDVWYALTRITTLDLEVKSVLAQRGYAVAVLKRGSRRLSCRCCDG